VGRACTLWLLILYPCMTFFFLLKPNASPLFYYFLFISTVLLVFGREGGGGFMISRGVGWLVGGGLGIGWYGIG